VWVDEQEKELTYSQDDELGRMQVELTAGDHEVYFRLTDTPIRAWSNLISLLSWASFLVIISQRKWQWLPIK
jgi:hypothetical protein